MSRGVFTVTMLDELRPQLEAWLIANGFRLSPVPGEDPDQLIVVPGPERWSVSGDA